MCYRKKVMNFVTIYYKADMGDMLATGYQNTYILEFTTMCVPVYLTLEVKATADLHFCSKFSFSSYN